MKKKKEQGHYFEMKQIKSYEMENQQVIFIYTAKSSTSLKNSKA